MLRQISLWIKQKLILNRKFGKAINPDEYEQVCMRLLDEVDQQDMLITDSSAYFKYLFTYIYNPENTLFLVFLTDQVDLPEDQTRIRKQIKYCYKEFMDSFGTEREIDPKDLEIFYPIIEQVHTELKPKISLVGYSGVGKTTINRLVTGKAIPVEHIPTMSGEIGTIQLGPLKFSLWDFAGQEQFSFLWEDFIRGSDAVLIITDSTNENCIQSKYFVDLRNEKAPFAKVAIIGNKQDLRDAVPVKDIERILGGRFRTYPMVATDPDNRLKMIRIIADILEIAQEDSDLFKPLVERDHLILEAENALTRGYFITAMNIFNRVVDLCVKMGDDSLAQQYHKKVEKLKLKVQEQITSGKNQPEKAKFPPSKPALEVGRAKWLNVKVSIIKQRILDTEIQHINGQLSDSDFREKVNQLKDLKEKIEKDIAQSEK